MKPKIPIIKIKYDSKKERAAIKTGKGGVKLRYVPTEKGFNQIIKRIKQTLGRQGIDYEKSYFRAFNSSKVNTLLKYGNDKASQKEKRKFDNIEWELYPFRLLRDYFYTDKRGNLLVGKNGPLMKNSPIKTKEEFIKAKGYRGTVYSEPADKDVVEYYNKIIKKYKKFDKNKNSKYYKIYQYLKRVKKEFPKKEKGIQPEFFLTEKLAMKKLRLMRDDVTFASKPTEGMGLEYILKDVLKKRVSEKITALVVYKNLIPVQPRKTKGGLDLTVLYTFKKDRLKHIVALFLLVPKELK